LNGFPDGQNHYFSESRSVKISQNIKRSTERHDEVMVDIETWYSEKSFELFIHWLARKWVEEWTESNGKENGLVCLYVH